MDAKTSWELICWTSIAHKPRIRDTLIAGEIIIRDTDNKWSARSEMYLNIEIYYSYYVSKHKT